MSVAIWCVFIAFLMPYVLVILAKSGGYDNHNPRPGLAALTGWRARAHSAQLNCFEAFAPFAASVILAQYVGVSELLLSTLSLIFIASRTMFSIAYVMDKDSIRSFLWAIAWGSTIALFILAATH